FVRTCANSSLSADIVICLSMVLLYLFWQYRAYFSVRYCLRFISRNTANSIAVFFAPNQRPRARYRTTTSRYIQIRANRFGALKVADAKTTTSKSFIRGSSSKKRMCLISLLIRSPLFESVFSTTVFQEMLQPHIPPQWRQDPQRTLAR